LLQIESFSTFICETSIAFDETITPIQRHYLVDSGMIEITDTRKKPAMIVHVVMFKAQTSQKDQLPAIKAKLEALPAQIEQIQQYEVGLDEVGSDRSYDMVLYSRFASYDDLQTYQQHPEHQAVLSDIQAVMAQVHAVDYTLPE